MATKLGRTRRMARKLINSPKALASSRYVFLSFLNSYFLIVVGVFGRLLVHIMFQQHYSKTQTLW